MHKETVTLLGVEIDVHYTTYHCDQLGEDIRIQSMYIEQVDVTELLEHHRQTIEGLVLDLLM